MLQPEREPTAPQLNRTEQYEGARKRRRRALGEQAARSFTLLPEIETANDAVREYLISRVIGQDAAIEAIVSALDRSGVRSHEDTRPKASFAFLGRTGIGKTETAKALSEILSPYDPNLISIDCAMFSNGHEVAALTGAPPGFVGRKQPPLLRPSVVEREGTVILFDEVEKAAKELHNLLLHITDKGELTLHDGTSVSFRNTVIIMTSNLGAREMAREADGGRAGFGSNDSSEITQQAIEAAALKGFADFFSPEFVGRTRQVVFHPLGGESLHKVLDVKLHDLNKVYTDDFGAMVRLSPKAREHLVDKALTRKASGVRPLVDALDEDVAATFGRYIARDHIQEGTEVHVYHRDELGEDLPEEYKRDFIFLTVPNATIKRKIVEPPVPPPPAPMFIASSTEIMKINDTPDVVD